MIASVEEMIATVQIYIHHRKDKEVNVKIRNGRDLILLQRAYSTALNWLNNNNFTIYK